MIMSWSPNFYPLPPPSPFLAHLGASQGLCRNRLGNLSGRLGRMVSQSNNGETFVLGFPEFPGSINTVYIWVYVYIIFEYLLAIYKHMYTVDTTVCRMPMSCNWLSAQNPIHIFVANSHRFDVDHWNNFSGLGTFNSHEASCVFFSFVQ